MDQTPRLNQRPALPSSPGAGDDGGSSLAL